MTWVEHNPQVVQTAKTKAGIPFEMEAVIKIETSTDANGILKISKVTEFFDRRLLQPIWCQDAGACQRTSLEHNRANVLLAVPPSFMHPAENTYIHLHRQMTNRLGSAMTHFLLLVFVIPLLIIPFPSMMFLYDSPPRHRDSSPRIYTARNLLYLSLVSSWFLLN